MYLTILSTENIYRLTLTSFCKTLHRDSLSHQERYRRLQGKIHNAILILDWKAGFLKNSYLPSEVHVLEISYQFQYSVFRGDTCIYGVKMLLSLHVPEEASFFVL